MAWIKWIGWQALRIFIGLNILLLLLAGAYVYDENKTLQCSWMVRIHYALNKTALNELAEAFLKENNVELLMYMQYWSPPQIRFQNRSESLIEPNAEQSERYLKIFSRFWPKVWTPQAIGKTDDGRVVIFMDSSIKQGRLFSFVMLYWPDGTRVTHPCEDADLDNETGNCDIDLADKWTANYDWGPGPQSS